VDDVEGPLTVHDRRAADGYAVVEWTDWHRCHSCGAATSLYPFIVDQLLYDWEEQVWLVPHHEVGEADATES